jgi:ABC-type multidrug transport system fused ATPase/permease subunit
VNDDAGTLPVADARTTRAAAGALLATHRGPLRRVLALHGLAAVAGLAGPAVVGRLVDGVLSGTTAGRVDALVGVLAAALAVQVGLTWAARRASFVLAETVFARLREEFLASVTRLPLSTVERAGSGDLVSRTTNDVEAVSYSVRYAVPRIGVALVTVALTLVALVVAGPQVSPAVGVGVPLLLAGGRWYLRRARDGYLAEMASYATTNGSVTETVDAARTVSAAGLASRRRAQADADLRASFDRERYTLRLRTVWYPVTELAYVLPIVAALAWGGWLVAAGHASVGQVTAVTLYCVQLVEPLDEVLSWLDELQVGGASLARIVGVSLVPDDRTPSGAVPADERLRAGGVRYAYRAGRDVLHGIDLDLVAGERLAVVGPSGAGKSTLGRLLAGVHPPRDGRVSVGGVPLVDLPLDDLRGHVALITQEHHVFVGTLADNLRLARPDADEAALLRALGAVDALDWAQALPAGLATTVGSGGHPLGPAQAQQVALARLVLADPHTLVLDEATSLLDPRSARHLERSLSAVLTGRTVVAVAHRLHTAHDADRVAVVEDGRITELGAHGDLVELDGSYAALWRSWRDERPAATVAGGAG